MGSRLYFVHLCAVKGNGVTPGTAELPSFIPLHSGEIASLGITPESRTLDQPHAETGDVLSRRCIHDLGPVKMVGAVRGFLLVPPGETA